MRKTILFLATAALCRTGLVFGGAESAAPTLDEIRLSIQHARDAITSVWYVAESSGYAALSADRNIQSRRLTVAIKGENRFVESAHYYPGLDWTDDVEWSKTSLAPGHLEVFWPRTRMLQLSKRDADVTRNAKLRPVYYEFFLECTGWWPKESASGTKIQPLPTSLHLILADKSCRLVGLDAVNGHRCVLVERGAEQKLWLATDLGFALVKRIIYQPQNQHVLYLNSSFREVAPGVWFPTSMKRTIARDPAEGATSVFTDSERIIRNVSVNKVNDSVFVLERKPGTIVTELDSKKQTQIPGGLDLLDEVARLAKSLKVAAGVNSNKMQSRISTDLYTLLLGAVALLPWCLLFRRYLPTMLHPKSFLRSIKSQ